MRTFLARLRKIIREEEAHRGDHPELRARSNMRTVQGLSLLVFLIYAVYQLVFLFRNGHCDLRPTYLIPIVIVVCAGPLASFLLKRGYTTFLAKYALVGMHTLMFLLAFWLDCFTDPSLCVVYTPLFIAVGPVILLQSAKTELIINTLALVCYIAAGLAGLTPIAADHAVVTGLVAYLLSLASVIVVSTMRYSIAATTRELEYKNANIKAERQQRRALLEALNAARQSTVAKTTFLNSISHDIRTPMNAIMGFSARAGAHLSEPEVVKESLDQINTASEQLLKYLSNIMEVTQIKSSRIGFVTSQFSLSELAGELTQSLQPSLQAKRLHFSCNASDITEDMVHADKDRLRQVLMVVLENAINYTQPGGNISFSIRQNQRVSPKLIRYTFTVKDTGQGMSKEYLAQVFDPFSRAADTTHSGIAGAGLGLPLAKSMIESAGGVIQLESELGKGTVATIVLPLGVNERAPETEEPNETSTDGANLLIGGIPLAFTDVLPGENTGNASASKGKAQGGAEGKNESRKVALKPSLEGAHVLVVDDNMINREVAGDLLKEKGLQVDTAASGKEGLAMFEASEPNHYAAILMDIMMPGMDGMETTRAIRRLERPDAQNTLIIALSANVHTNDSEAAVAAGMNMFLAKPFQVDSFVRILNELI